MNRTLPLVAFVFCAIFCLPAFAQNPDAAWTALFDRSEVWLGADGIFSIPLDGNDALESATKNTKTLFVFSDSFVGTADPETHRYKDARMVNHSAAILEGNEPDPGKIRFVYGKQGDMSRTNLFDVKTWLQDGIAIDGAVYVIGLRPGDKDWKPIGLDLYEIPLGADGWPDWTKTKRTADVPILLRGEKEHINFGIGILDQSAADGFVYVYGYRDDLKTQHKNLVVARVPKKSFPDFTTWMFWNGFDWSKELDAVLSDNAILAERVSCELSVTPLPDGRFILVYTKDVMSSRLEYRIGPTPLGPFEKPIPFYVTPEPKELGKGIYSYNAKAHPHLSKPGKLLISYNVNRMGGLPHKTDEYRPRFVELDLSTLKEPTAN